MTEVPFWPLMLLYAARGLSPEECMQKKKSIYRRALVVARCRPPVGNFGSNKLMPTSISAP